MAKITLINTCDECPHFDNEGNTPSMSCNILGKKIDWNQDLVHAIPVDCPLEDSSSLTKLSQDRYKKTDFI